MHVHLSDDTECPAANGITSWRPSSQQRKAASFDSQLLFAPVKHLANELKHQASAYGKPT